MAQEPHVPQFNLKINGQQAPKEVMDQMLDCTVENSLHLPDMCTVRIHDAGFKWLDEQVFREGKKMEVEGSEGESAPLASLFKGEITGLELDLAGHGVPTLVVRCFDRAHRLHRGRMSRSFVQVTDTDIVRKVGEEAGFSVEADGATEVYDWVMQNNQTNWEFLTDRARRIGYRLYVKDADKLCFKKVQEPTGDTIQLDWGKNLRSFRPRTSASPQVDEVTVRGWDPGRKEPIIGRCTNAAGTPDVGEDRRGGEVGHKAFGAARMVLVDQPIQTQNEADNLARSICDSIGNSFLEAEGLCYAVPGLMPGKVVEIKNIGRRFSGKYYVTATTHTYTPGEGYSTLFAVSGKQPGTLLSLLDGEDAAARMKLGGNIVIGVVTNNQDPEDRGRVKVRYPWLCDQDESYWVRVAAPMAGAGRGFYYIPEVDDEVLVAFEHGDIHRPYILGALWNGKDRVIEGNSKAVQGGKVNRRTIKTRIGHTVLFDDSGGKGEMSLTTANEHVLTLDDANENITVRTKSGHTVLLDDKGGKIVVMDKTKSNKLTIDSGAMSISLECVGNFSVQAKGKVSIQGMAGMDLTTPAVMTVQGSMVKIN